MSPLRTVRVIALALSASLCLALGAVHLAPARAAEHAPAVTRSRR
jgi:hypothetical protein